MNKVVIVDTGIDLFNDKLISNKKCIDGYLINKNAHGIIQVTNISENRFCIQDEIGHGTGIAEIIASHNNNVELTIIKIYSNNIQVTDENLLCFALDFVLQNIDFDILNLSLGIAFKNGNNKLENICKLYRNKNKIIISAFDNTGSLSFPASFESVIGVTSSDYCYKSDEYYITDGDCVNVCAKGRSQRIYWKDGKQIIGHGNSYACAHFSGILSKYCSSGMEYELRKCIQEHCCGVIKSKNDIYNAKNFNPISKYKKAVIFPYNKETHSLIRFSDKLPFELVDVYDIKYSAKIGAQTNTLLCEQCKHNYIIKDIANIDFDSFDTFILGHTDELMYVSNMNHIKAALIEKLLANNKNIYSFDDLSKYLSSNNKHLIYYPAVSYDSRYIAPFGKLYRQDKPVLGVFGTSSTQGKMTLQLRIRYELIKRGYKICQLGTEPSSLLYGMDIVFPIGYNSSVTINQYDTVAYLNKIIYDASRNTDLILVGCQSGIVLRDEGNLSNYLFQQIDFLYATLPDAIILCVNSFDDFDIIKRTIQFVESAICCKVIALSIYPFYYAENDALKQHRKEMSLDLFENKFKPMLEVEIGLPVFYSSDKRQVENLCNLIENTFSINI